MNKTIKIRVIIMTLVILSALSMGFTSEAASIKNMKAKTMNVGETYQIVIKGTKKKIKWSSSYKKIASVSSKGTVTAKSIGVTTITAKVGKKKYVYAINVVDDYKDSLKFDTAKEAGISLIAHRGMSSLAPENSIPAIEAACLNGYKLVEFDIYETKDGKFVLSHDPTVDRMTNGKGTITHMKWNKLKKFKIDNGNNVSKYKNLTIPTLEDALKVCKKYNVIPQIDIKLIRNPNKLLSLIKKESMLKKVQLVSTRLDILIELRKENANIPIYLIEDYDSYGAVNTARRYNFNGVSLTYHVTNKDIVDYAKENQMEVLVWTINNTKRFEQCIEYGVDGIVTDGLIR